MTDHITIGTHLTVLQPGDGTYQVQCPGCTHYIPNVPKSSLSPNEQTGLTDWIDCACPEGKGISTHYRIPFTGCTCVARFAVLPCGINGKVKVARVDEATMYARRFVSDTEYSVGVEEDGLFVGLGHCRCELLLEDIEQPIQDTQDADTALTSHREPLPMDTNLALQEDTEHVEIETLIAPIEPRQVTPQKPKRKR